MRHFFRVILGAFLGIGLVFNVSASNEGNSKKVKRSGKALEIIVKPVGPTQADIDAAKQRIENSSAIRSVLGGVNYRLMSFKYIESGDGSVPKRFEIVFYDYSSDRTYVAAGDFAGKEKINVREEFFDPGVSDEELADAANLIENDAEFGPLTKQQLLRATGAMPPTTYVNGERLINVELQSPNGENYQIVGISFKNRRIVKYENGAPPAATSAPEGSCGFTSAGQGSTANGTAGQYDLTVMQGKSPLWEMVVVRPSISSGRSSERSGIEIRDVKYKGKSVLKRGHAPIINVQYVNNACGPFRDWQYAEGNFNAPDAGATDPAPGVRILGQGQIATTLVETGVDSGNFRGVAIYQQDVGFGNEIVMVSEMNAGWYRYVMEWRFAPDGTIRPRYGFGSTTNGCVCNPRYHHVYWRFDFDIVSSNNKVFKVERGRKFLTPITTESSLLRQFGTNRSLLIQNSNGDEAYQLTPNLSDGSVANSSGTIIDAFGAGDIWVMQFKGSAGAPDELDDPNSGSAANIDPWINGESVENQDVVVWYGAHQYRTDATSLTTADRSGNVISGVHIVGPDLRPVRW